MARPRAVAVWQITGAWTRTDARSPRSLRVTRRRSPRCTTELAPSVFGVVRRVLRDPSQAEEVDPGGLRRDLAAGRPLRSERGSVRTWAVTIAHRRAVDRVRSEQAHRDRQLARRRSTRPSSRRPRTAPSRREDRERAQGGAWPELSRGPARGARAGVLRRAHPCPDRRAPGHRPGHREDPHPRRADPVCAR